MQNQTRMTDAEETALAEALVAEVPLPTKIERVEIRLGRDWTGDPAMWVVLWIQRGREFDAAKSSKLNKVAGEVQTKLINGPFTHFPYTTLD